MAPTDTASGFPHAPAGWEENSAVDMAREDGLELNEHHWETLRALQEYCSRHDCNKYSVRELHDALDEKFHKQGAVSYTHLTLPTMQ